MNSYVDINLRFRVRIIINTDICIHIYWYEFIHNDMNSYQRVVYYMNSYLIMNSYSLRYEFIHVDLNSY